MLDGCQRLGTERNQVAEKLPKKRKKEKTNQWLEMLLNVIHFENIKLEMNEIYKKRNITK